jgi:hypothetical protein
MGGHGESGEGGGEAKEYSQAGFDRSKRFLSSILSIVDAPATFFRGSYLASNFQFAFYPFTIDFFLRKNNRTESSEKPVFLLSS